MEKVRNMYLSYDSGKLTSTLINLDIEELTFCFSAAILNHIEYFLNLLKENPTKLIEMQ
jgi:hypothetical protein